MISYLAITIRMVVLFSAALELYHVYMVGNRMQIERAAYQKQI